MHTWLPVLLMIIVLTPSKQSWISRDILLTNQTLEKVNFDTWYIYLVHRRVMFFLLYSCKQYKNPVSNIHFWSIMLKISFISTNYIILFELKEYLCIFLVFSCSIFIFATIICCFFLSTKMKIGSRLLQKSPFWKQNYWREMITWSISSLVKIWKISHCVFSVSYCQLYNKI